MPLHYAPFAFTSYFLYIQRALPVSAQPTKTNVMLTKLEASVKLYLLVFVMLLFTLLLGFYGLNGMRAMNQNTRTLYADRVFPLQQLANIRYSYSSGILSAAEHAQSGQLGFLAAQKRVEETWKTIDVNWNAYLLTYITPEENKLAKEASALMNGTTKTVDQLKTILNEGDAHALDEIIRKELYPAIDPIIAKLNELTELQVRISGNLHENSIGVYNTSFKKLLLIIALSLFFAVPFSYYLVRSVKHLIGNLRAANDQLKEYKHFFYNSNDLFCIANVQGYIETLNPQFMTLLGYSKEELFTNQFYRFIHPDDIPATEREIEKLKTGVTSINFINRFREKAGNYLWFEWNTTLDHVNGKIYSIARDITQRKLAEDQLRLSEERFSKAFRAAPVSIAVSRISDGTLFEVNEAMEKFLEYSRAEMIGHTTAELQIWANKGDREYLVGELTKNGFLHGHDFSFRTKGGRIVTANLSAEVIELAGEKCFLSVFVDITERRRAEKSLKESEKKYRNIFENVQDVFYQTNLSGNILDVSPSIYAFAGWTREEMIGQSVASLYYFPEDREKWISLLKEKGELKEFELFFKTRSGEPIYASVDAHLIRGADGHVSHIDGSLRDITKRKRAEKNLQQSEARLKEAQAIAHIGNWEIDMLSNTHIWSDEIYHIYGVNKEEVLPSVETMLSFMHTDDVLVARAGINAALTTRTNAASNFRFVQKDGSLRYAHIEWRFEFDKTEQPTRLYGTLQDITERKKTQESIRQSEANYRQLFKLSPAPMWVVDEETYRFNQVNQACINNYGYSDQEFADMTIMNIISQTDDTNVKQMLTQKEEDNIFFVTSHKHIKKSGEIIDVETSSIPVILNGKEQILVIAIDVTEKNRYEQKLTRAAIKAQEEERYEIGGELHDNVCQVLAGSLIYLGMLKKGLSPGSTDFFDKTHQFITLAANEIRSLSHRLAPAFFDDATLEYAFDNLLKDFNVEKKYRVSLHFDNAFKNHHFNREMELSLYRILQEQLRNIFKHAHATSIEVGLVISNGMLQMRINDNGVGFDALGSKGGIGLANMNRRVQLFSGKLAINSVAGNGCEVLVSIPL
jgi:PAS domain S-box-containing protein